MKLLLAVLLLFCVEANGNAAYEIPRSAVIELKEQSSSRVYPLFIQLPATYNKQPDKVYPVIYLVDAHYSFPLISGATRFPMNSGVMQQAIIVAVSYEQGSKGASSRIRDYTPSNAKAWRQETGNASGHMAFIRDTVFPFIEQNYRASNTNRTFVGNSLGGLFGTYILFTEPALFANYILGSPSVWFDNNMILAASVVKPKAATRVYISVGEYETPAYGEGQDMLAGAKQLTDKILALNSGNIDLRFSVVSGASHATAFPTTAIQGLDWIYGIKKQ
ncbi:alpha/beta hydrolase [Rheinheimera baltica]|uniref:alpha/beta hydrolase n=1 Tax=Rheinheimera baltica TaxID=67576 RepID=UPI00273F96E4|nr:alpha/beta hydrolase-fold protein [Rheinheimera baltica]MDP5148891.1 alpha/beta hydrolase-fold protein [Rheinheimera baltica]